MNLVTSVRLKSFFTRSHILIKQVQCLAPFCDIPARLCASRATPLGHTHPAELSAVPVLTLRPITFWWPVQTSTHQSGSVNTPAGDIRHRQLAMSRRKGNGDRRRRQQRHRLPPTVTPVDVRCPKRMLHSYWLVNVITLTDPNIVKRFNLCNAFGQLIAMQPTEVNLQSV